MHVRVECVERAERDAVDVDVNVDVDVEGGTAGMSAAVSVAALHLHGECGDGPAGRASGVSVRRGAGWEGGAAERRIAVDAVGVAARAGEGEAGGVVCTRRCGGAAC